MRDSHAATESIGVLAPEQAVLYRGRHATFLHMSRGAAIIRYWGDSHAVSVRPEALSLPPPRIPARPGRPLPAQDEPIARELARGQLR